MGMSAGTLFFINLFDAIKALRYMHLTAYSLQFYQIKKKEITFFHLVLKNSLCKIATWITDIAVM